MEQKSESERITLPFKGKETDFEIRESREVSLGHGHSPRTIRLLSEPDSNPPSFSIPDREIVQIARLIAAPPKENLARQTRQEKDILQGRYTPQVRGGVAYLPEQDISISYDRDNRTAYVLPGDARPPVLTNTKKVAIGLAIAITAGIGLNLVMDESNGQNGPTVPKYPHASLFKKIPPAQAHVDSSGPETKAPEEKKIVAVPPRPAADIAPGVFVNPATGEKHGSRPAALKDSRIDCAAGTVESAFNMALLSPHLEVQTDPKSGKTTPLIGMPYGKTKDLFEQNAQVTIKDPDSGALKSGYVAYIPSLERMEAFLGGLGLGPKNVKWDEVSTDPKVVAAAEKFMSMVTCGGQIVDSRIVKNTEKPGQEKGGVYPPGYALTDISFATTTPYAQKVIRDAELEDNLDQQVYVRIVLRDVDGQKGVWIGHTAAPEKYEDHLTDSYLKKALKLAQEEGNFSADHGKGAIEAPHPVATAIMLSRPAQSTPGHERYGQVTTVPEPTSIALFGLGVLGLAFWRTRQAKEDPAEKAPLPRMDGPDLTP